MGLLSQIEGSVHGEMSVHHGGANGNGKLIAYDGAPPPPRSATTTPFANGRSPASLGNGNGNGNGASTNEQPLPAVSV